MTNVEAQREAVLRRIQTHFPTSIEPHMLGAIERYVLDGIQPGGFLTALLSNDLFGAFGKADLSNRHNMFKWVEFVYNFTPSGCHGSPERVSDWIKQGGYTGYLKRIEGEAV